jgi:opacity protein-like surface antigen
MKKLFYLFLLLPLFSLGQNQTNMKDTKFAVGLCFSPDYSYRYLSTDVDAKKFIKEERDTSETPDFGFTAGVSLHYSFNKRFAVESGLLYSKKGYKKTLTKFSAFDPNDPLIPERAVFYSRFDYLCVPVKFNYVFIDKRFKLFVTAGVSANFFIKEETKIVSEFSNRTTVKYVEDNISDFRKLNLEFLAGIGADYNLNKHFKLRLEPLFRRSINSITTTDIKGYLYSGGLNFGVYYKF